MKKRITLVVIILLLLALAVFYAMMKRGDEKLGGKGEQTGEEINQLSADLSGKGNQAGKAAVTVRGDKVQTVVTSSNIQNPEAQKIFLRAGSCKKPGDVKYILSPFKGGKSETILDINITKLSGQMPLSIYIGTSNSDVTICGELAK